MSRGALDSSQSGRTQTSALRIWFTLPRSTILGGTAVLGPARSPDRHCVFDHVLAAATTQLASPARTKGVCIRRHWVMGEQRMSRLCSFELRIIFGRSWAQGAGATARTRRAGRRATLLRRTGKDRGLSSDSPGPRQACQPRPIPHPATPHGSQPCRAYFQCSRTGDCIILPLVSRLCTGLQVECISGGEVGRTWRRRQRRRRPDTPIRPDMPGSNHRSIRAPAFLFLIAVFGRSGNSFAKGNRWGGTRHTLGPTQNGGDNLSTRSTMGSLHTTATIRAPRRVPAAWWR